MKWVEAAGLVKFDFLGLKTLTVLAQTVELIRARARARRSTSADLPLDDRPTFEMLGRGDTVGVFQLESAGMRDVLRKLKPDTFEDIIAVVALYRPGPMDNIPSYIRRKHGEEEADYLYPTLEGDPARDLRHHDLPGAGDADRPGAVRLFARQRRSAAPRHGQEDQGGDGPAARDLHRAAPSARGVPEAKASQIFELVSKFAGYGFNKSHAAAYALIAYQTAYLKANYPLEFFAASMTLDLGNTDKLNGFRQELEPARHPAAAARHQRVRGRSSASSTTGRCRSRRHPLRAGRRSRRWASRRRGRWSRSAGATARSRSLADFAAPPRPAPSQQAAAREPGARRRLRLAERQPAPGLRQRRGDRCAAPAAATADAGQRPDRPVRRRPACAAAAPAARRGAGLAADGAAERGAGGDRLLSLRPSARYLRAEAEAAEDDPLGRLAGLRPVRAGDAAGTVIVRKERTSGKGNKYAFVQLSDTSGVFEVTVFSELLAAERDRLEPGCSLLLHVNAQAEGDAVRCVAQRIEALDEAMERLADGIDIFFDSAAPLPAIRAALADAGAGRGQIKLIPWLDGGREVEIALPSACRISAALLGQLRAIPGVRDVARDVRADVARGCRGVAIARCWSSPAWTDSAGVPQASRRVLPTRAALVDDAG